MSGEDYINIKDDSIKILGKLKLAVSDPMPILEQIGRGAAELMRRAIISETTPEGQRMTPLAPVTIEAKRGSKILRDTGQMLNSITSRLYGADTVITGASVNYAATHQTGKTINAAGKKHWLIPGNWEARQGLRTKKKRKGAVFYKKKSVTIPARPFVPSRPIDQYTEYLRMISQVINATIEKAKKQ